jgi:hypothetical protein
MAHNKTFNLWLPKNKFSFAEKWNHLLLDGAVIRPKELVVYLSVTHSPENDRIYSFYGQ